MCRHFALYPYCCTLKTYSTTWIAGISKNKEKEGNTLRYQTAGKLCCSCFPLWFEYEQFGSCLASFPRFCLWFLRSLSICLYFPPFFVLIVIYHTRPKLTTRHRRERTSTREKAHLFRLASKRLSAFCVPVCVPFQESFCFFLSTNVFVLFCSVSYSGGCFFAVLFVPRCADISFTFLRSFAISGVCGRFCLSSRLGMKTGRSTDDVR